MTPPEPETREHLPTPPTLTHAPGGTATHDPNQTVTHDAGGADAPVSGTGRYERTSLHAAGGMGRVWVARDSALGRDVALKELRPDRAASPATRARFVAEARTTGRLEHPNIVPVYEYAPPDGGRAPFYVMRFVAGRTLAEVGKEYHERRAAGTATAVEFRDLLSAFLGVCNAIAYAHGRGVLHRDLKGANVVLGKYGEVVVLDWGLAKWSGDEPAAEVADSAGQLETTAGTVMGTPSYMAPEQAAGRTDLIDARTDVYGLGAVLYELLTGRPPFTGPDTATVLRRVQSDSPPAPRLVAPDTPRPLDAICLKAVAKNPADRYAAAADLADDVRRFLADEPVAARREPALERVARRLRKNRTLAAALAVAAAVLIPALAVFADVKRRNAKAMAGEQKQTADAKALADARLEQVVGTWYTQLITVQNELDQQVVSPTFRLRVLLAAKDRLADVLRDQPRTRATDHMRHVLHRRLAYVFHDTHDLAGAARELAVARRIADERFRDDPDGPDSRRDVADSLLALADIRTTQARWDDALAALAEAEAHLAAIAGDARADDDRVSLADRRARVLVRAKRDATAAAAEAVRAARENAAVRPGHPHAQSLVLSALQTAVAEAHGRRASAADYLTEALARVDAELKLDEGNPQILSERAKVLSLRGEDAALKGDVAGARDWFHKALAIRAELALPTAAPPDAVLDLAATHQRLGDLSYNARHYTDAVIELGQASRHLNRVVTANPTRAARKMQGDLLARLGAVELGLGQAAEAREHLTKCEAIRRALADESPADSAAKRAHAEAHRLLADLEKSPTVLRFDAAERHYKKAVELVGGVKPGDQFAADADWGAKYCRSVLDVIADPAKAPADPNTAYPLFIARMRVLAKAGDAAGAVRTGEIVRRLNPKHRSYIEAEARGHALALKAEKDAAAKETHAVAAGRLLAEAGHGTSTPPDADFAALRTYRAPPIPAAAEGGSGWYFFSAGGFLNVTSPPGFGGGGRGASGGVRGMRLQPCGR